jgi:hypothetical protein
MKTYRIVAIVLMALPLSAQTAAELLQKGIYDQETAGDLDGAIAIYHQIVNSGSSPRDVAAQAQYRLAQSLLQKGDLPNGAQEFSNLARNYADYGKLVSSLATQARANTFFFSPGPSASADERAFADRAKAAMANLQALKLQQEALQTGGAGDRDLKRLEELKRAVASLDILAAQQGLSGAGGRGGGRSMSPGLLSMSFDPASPVSVKGVVFRMEIMSPSGAISVDPQDGSGKRYTFVTAAPRETAQQGLTRDSLHAGDSVAITGVLSKGAQALADGTIAASASTITLSDGRKVFDRALLSPSSNTCNWVSATIPPPCPASK